RLERLVRVVEVGTGQDDAGGNMSDAVKRSGSPEMPVGVQRVHQGVVCRIAGGSEDFGQLRFGIPVKGGDSERARLGGGRALFSHSQSGRLPFVKAAVENEQIFGRVPVVIE